MTRQKNNITGPKILKVKKFKGENRSHKFTANTICWGNNSLALISLEFNVLFLLSCKSNGEAGSNVTPDLTAF